MKLTRHQEEDKMRADYGLYVVAIICFIIAALPYYYTNVISEELLQLDSFTSTALTVIFAALGLIFAIVGYSLRPKPIISIHEAIPPASPPPSPPSLAPPEEATTVPPPAPVPPSQPQEEIIKPEKKKPKRKTKRKTTRRRRKKA